jgi:hypothetical protein
MTNRVRAGLFVLGGLLSTLALGAAELTHVPATAAAVSVAPSGVQSEALEAEPDAAPEPTPGEQIPIADPTLQASAAVELSGELVVTITEEPDAHSHVPESGAHAEESSEDHSEFSYSVETADGAVVPIAGALPESVSTGDDFSGSVAVDATVVEALSPEAAAEVETSAGAGSALPEASAATQEVLDAASTTSTELPVVEAQVTVAAAAAASVQSHELVFVVNSPPGTSVPQSDAHIRNLGGTAAAHWQASSNGLISTFTTNPTITRTSAGTCNEDVWVTWNRAAQQLGYSSWSQFKSMSPAGTARHLIVLQPVACQSLAGVGVGIVGSSLHYGGAVRQIIGGGADTSTLAHEVGHNFGLGHSNLQYCTGTTCSSYEYWDIYDVMGLGISGRDVLTPLNTTTASRLGFLPADSTESYSLASGSMKQTLSLSVTRLSATSGVRLLKITDPRTKQVFYIELRDGLGSPQPYYALNPTVTQFGGRSVTFTPGVRMLRPTGNGSAVIASPQPTGHHRTAIQAGQSMTSPSGGITVTAVSGTPNTAMQLRVTLDASMPVYRFWSDTYQGHFYTVSANEKANIIATYPAHIWRYEAVAYSAFTTQVAGTVPLYRFWSDTMRGHFFTASASEKDHVIAAYDDSVWKYEGIAYYVYPVSNTTAATKPVYRFWSETKRHHFYTASEAEKNKVIATYARSVWAYEQAAYKVPAQ